MLPVLPKGAVLSEPWQERNEIPIVTLTQIFSAITRLTPIRIIEPVSLRDADLMKRLTASNHDITTEKVHPYGANGNEEIVEWLELVFKHVNEESVPINVVVLYLAHGKGLTGDAKEKYTKAKRHETTEKTKIQIFSRISPTLMELAKWLEWLDELIVAYIQTYGTPPERDIEGKLLNWPWKVDSFGYIETIFDDMRVYIGRVSQPKSDMSRLQSGRQNPSREQLQRGIVTYLHKVLDRKMIRSTFPGVATIPLDIKSRLLEIPKPKKDADLHAYLNKLQTKLASIVAENKAQGVPGFTIDEGQQQRKRTTWTRINTLQAEPEQQSDVEEEDQWTTSPIMMHTMIPTNQPIPQPALQQPTTQARIPPIPFIPPVQQYATFSAPQPMNLPRQQQFLPFQQPIQQQQQQIQTTPALQVQFRPQPIQAPQPTYAQQPQSKPQLSSSLLGPAITGVAGSASFHNIQPQINRIWMKYSDEQNEENVRRHEPRLSQCCSNQRAQTIPRQFDTQGMPIPFENDPSKKCSNGCGKTGHYKDCCFRCTTEGKLSIDSLNRISDKERFCTESELAVTDGIVGLAARQLSPDEAEKFREAFFYKIDTAWATQRARFMETEEAAKRARERGEERWDLAVIQPKRQGNYRGRGGGRDRNNRGGRGGVQQENTHQAQPSYYQPLSNLPTFNHQQPLAVLPPQHQHLQQPTTTMNTMLPLQK